MKTIFVKLSAFAARIVIVSFALSAAPAFAQEVVGDWAGLLAGQLHIIVHITKSADGHYGGSLESPDQGAFVLPAENVEATPTHLAFSIPKLGGSYDGTWDDSTRSWTGTWKQGQSIPFNLTRLSAQALGGLKPKRPQEDAIAAAPLPYHQHDVTFGNPSARVTLAGTFTVPNGTGPFPSVVLICGSGPHTRDEDVSGHRIFLVLADALNRRGIAVLRYDKRGVGDSTGDFATATSIDFASDADAAVAFLNTRPEVDKARIGLIGHSEGGAIAPSIAIRNPSVAFTVLMAGPAMRTDRLTVLQESLIAKAQGASDDAIAKHKAFSEKLYAGLIAAKTDDEARSIARSSVAQAVADNLLPADAAEATVQQVTSPWLRQALSYDPVSTLRKLKTPTLVLYGSLDLQVPSNENLALMRTALKDNKTAAFIELPNLNHMFQTAKTGSPAEYAQIEETMSPSALKSIVDWVVAFNSTP
jgi:pimeloyl-ACP methyl ester carboxylesterase